MKKFDKLAVVAPRGHAKTTLMNVIYVLHRVLYGEERFVLLISESEEQSKMNLGTIAAELEENPKIKLFFGDRTGKRFKKKWGETVIDVVTGFDAQNKPDGFCRIMVRGVTQKIRGLKYGPYRPTLEIIDDGEGDGNSLTPDQRRKFRRWINAAMIPGADDARILFIGTIIDDDAYLNRLVGGTAGTKTRKVIGWKALFYQACPQTKERGRPRTWDSPRGFDEDGVPEVLWPERRPYSWLKDEHDRLESEGELHLFYQEYQGIPMGDEFRIFKSKDMRWYSGYHIRKNGHNFLVLESAGADPEKMEPVATTILPISVFIGMDPASSENVRSNPTAIIVIGVTSDYTVYLLDYYKKSVTPIDGADQLYIMAAQYHPDRINIERTGHIMLEGYMRKMGKEKGVFLPIAPKDAIKNKNYRIKELQPMHGAHSIYFLPSHVEVEQEMLNFSDVGNPPKDLLDGLKWSTDDMFPPGHTVAAAGEKYQPPEIQTGEDWETGQLI
jgi:hypothetical protein